MIQSVVHMVDDASWGGVNRLLECLETTPSGLTRDLHRIMRVERGLKKSPLIRADAIVSHMAICWKNVPFFSSLRATHPETPIVHVEHSYSERYVALKVNKRSRFDDLLRLSYALFDKVVAVSAPQAVWLNRRGFVQPDQQVTISSCVSLAPFELVANQEPKGPVTLGALGRFHEQKGFDILVDAFTAHAPSNLRLLLVGGGPDHAKLVSKAKGQSNIIFHPHTDHPAAAMAQCDAVAMPSRWEPYGLVALEAMAARRPLFCARVDGLRQHIAEGALAVGENTAEGWAQVFKQLTSREAVKALPLSSAAIKAEWQFINAWNVLIHNLTQNIEINQSAA